MYERVKYRTINSLQSGGGGVAVFHVSPGVKRMKQMKQNETEIKGIPCIPAKP